MQTSPAFPAGFPTELTAVLLGLTLFGIGYNRLIAYAHHHALWHVSVSVALGVAVTLLVPAVVWWRLSLAFWQSGLVLVLCFTASGVPMMIGSARRTIKARHERRPWPNAALKARDDVVMELSALADEIAEKTKSETLKVQDMADYVHRLHQMKGTLKSV